MKKYQSASRQKSGNFQNYSEKDRKLFALYESIEKKAIQEYSISPDDKSVITITESIPIQIPRNVLRNRKAILNAAIGIGKSYQESIKDFWKVMRVDDPVLCRFIAHGEKPEKILKKGDEPFAAGLVGAVWKLESPEGHLLVIKETIEKVNVAASLRYMKVAISDRAVYRAAGGLNFLNAVLVSYAAADVLSHTPRSNRIALHLDAFVCNRVGYIVQEFATHGTLGDYIRSTFKTLTLQEFDNSLVKIVRDLFETLDLLKNKSNQYNHGDLKADNVLMSLDNRGQIIAKISDFDKSSITWKGVRFFNGRYLSEYHAHPSNIPNPLVIAPFVEETDESFYTVPVDDNRSSKNGKAFMMSPIPFHLSYDYYILVISIALHHEVSENLLIKSQTGSKSKFLKCLETMFPDSNQFQDVVVPQIIEKARLGAENPELKVTGTFASMSVLSKVAALRSKVDLKVWK